MGGRTEMTNEDILKLAEKHFDYQGGWVANTEDLLKFARAIYQEGVNYGYDKVLGADL